MRKKKFKKRASGRRPPEKKRWKKEFFSPPQKKPPPRGGGGPPPLRGLKKAPAVSRKARKDGHPRRMPALRRPRRPAPRKSRNFPQTTALAAYPMACLCGGGGWLRSLPVPSAIPVPAAAQKFAGYSSVGQGG